MKHWVNFDIYIDRDIFVQGNTHGGRGVLLGYRKLVKRLVLGCTCICKLCSKHNLLVSQDHAICTGCVFLLESIEKVFLWIHSAPLGGINIVLDICKNEAGTGGQNYTIQKYFDSRREAAGEPT